MSDVILRIISIIGIVILILLGMVLILLLLVLFWPVTYRVKGEKSPEKLWITARADWLFGLLRVRYTYPEPGNVVIKLLWKTLADTGQPKEASEEKQESGGHTGASMEKAEEDDGTGEKKSEAENITPSDTAGAEGGPEASEPKDADFSTDEPAADAEEPAQNKPFLHVFEKIQKIKYTILNIYDKIKEIWANISYYIALLREEDTVLLWEHVKLRLGKILKNIRPRHMKANVLFGTGSPDTTGYAFGIYGMLSPFLGKKVCLTPDFDQKILEGNIDVSGHITIWTLTWNALKLLLDKKLKRFIKKMKAGRKGNGR